MAPGTDRVALVTGASAGIGEAAARALLGAGFTVYGTSRKPRADGVASRTCGGLPRRPANAPRERSCWGQVTAGSLSC